MRAARAESDLRSSREAKRLRTGVCEDCGGVTRYGGQKGRPVSLVCNWCSTKRVGVKQRGTGSAQARILDFLGDGERRFPEICDGCGFTPGSAASHLYRLVKYELVERVRRGVYRRSP